MNKISFSNLLAALVIIILVSSCTNDNIGGPNVPPLDETTIWSGPTVTFEKADNVDPTVSGNQDRITGNVWITRGNAGGQIYNAVTESSANKDISPAGTLWAIGTTSNLENLTFGRFRATVEKPRTSVGTNLVLLLVEENIAIDLIFTSWSSDNRGGFAYERSSN